jgi:hypothetical protein
MNEVAERSQTMGTEQSKTIQDVIRLVMLRTKPLFGVFAIR